MTVTPARGNDAKAIINSNLRKSIEADPNDLPLIFDSIMIYTDY
jgi:hypothetical protein